MPIIPLEYSDSLCELRTDDNQLIIVGKISEITDEHLQIRNPYSRLPVIFVNTPVKLQIYNEEVGFRMANGLVWLSTENFIRITDIRFVVNKERRNFFRVFAKMDLRACCIGDDDPGAINIGNKNFVPSAMDWFPITLVNISLGGVYFTTNRALSTAGQVLIELPIKKGQIFNYRIVNMTKLDNGRYGCGCQFLSDRSTPVDLICSFIFDQQRRIIREVRERY